MSQNGPQVMLGTQTTLFVVESGRLFHMEIWNWLIRLWLGDEPTFGAAMKTNSVKMSLKLVVVLVVSAIVVWIVAFIASWGSNSAPTIPKTSNAPQEVTYIGTQISPNCNGSQYCVGLKIGR